MLQPQPGGPLRVLERAFNSFTLSSRQSSRPGCWTKRILATPTSSCVSPKSSSLPFLPLSLLRYASHNTQGHANAGGRDSPGKRLGAKKTGEQYVVPGNIIFRQRGTKWFPGENCGMGRDHTIFAKEAGYVKYYVDPERHPKRKYIGVCFERDGRLPTPRHLPTRRRLNMIAVPRQMENSEFVDNKSVTMATDSGVLETRTLISTNTGLSLRPGYFHREANWQIGRAAEKEGIKAPKFNRQNRWLAWRKRTARADRAAQMKSLKNKKKNKGRR
jgi:large subunit ribosomal protein L27